MSDNAKTGPDLQTYQQWAAERQAALPPVRVEADVGCRYCLGLQRWEGDAPLPFPLTIFDKGLDELHCGYDGAPSPRFRFVCPICTANAEAHASATKEPIA
jgi:hypothetical protein